MKIIHTSDLHLDSPLTTRLDSKKVKERKSELILSFRRMVERAKSEKADAFIIAGDLFDSERVGKRTLKNVIDIIASAPELSFFYLSGNHEKKVLSASDIPLPENIRLFDDDWTYFSVGDVNIIGRCETAPDMFSKIKLSGDRKNIVVLHGELRDRSDFGGVIGKKDAEELNIDYLALGHYHSYSETEISPRCKAVYSGTPEGRGFDESGECGYVTIKTYDGYVQHEFTKSAIRTLHIAEIDVTDAPSDISLIYKIESALKNARSGDLIRIRLVGTRELGRFFDTDALLSSLKSSYYYIEAKDDTRLKISADDFKNDVSLKGEFIRGVIADDSLDDKEKEAIINLGLSVLIEEV